MFSSLKSKVLLGFYILLIIAIPVGSYLISEERNLASKAQPPKKTKTSESTPSASISGAKDLQRLSEQPPAKSPTPKPSPTTTTTVSFGPTLSLKVALDGRSKGNYATRLFVGMAEGALTTNPKFLLIFNVNLPASGEYRDLSLAGLSSGGKYTALLKGQAQIATSSAFTMSPTVTNLNDGKELNMLSGDLNDDNAINSADYSIAKKVLGTTSSSSNWNENADLNKDGVVNTIDLSIIAKNLGKVGASGSWVSPLPQIATPSASSGQASSGQPSGLPTGYWLWVPGI